MNSEHPLAKAIVEYAKKFREDEGANVWPEAEDFESITGHGVKAVVRNKEVIVGNKSLMSKKNILVPAEAEELLEETEGSAQTGILVSIDRELVGLIAISDPLKSGARDAISILRSMNIKTILVTGDNWGTAYSIAREVGIETVIAEAKPEDKAEKVKELQVRNINMFPSLSAFHKSINLDYMLLLMNASLSRLKLASLCGSTHSHYIVLSSFFFELTINIYN